MEHIDILIIGAGVVGLAVAAELTERFKEHSVVLIDKGDKFGQEISSRNSEVIHAGLYYPTGSVKARTCVEGNRLLYLFCEEWGVPYQRLGKLIIACHDTEIPALESIQEQGQKNGISDLEFLEGRQLARMEPCLDAVAALFSPSTGVINTHRLMAQLQWITLKKGGLIAYRHEAIRLEHKGNKFHVYCKGPDNKTEIISCSWLINCAGLSADRIAKGLGMDIDEANYRIYFCKGEYFSVSQSKANLISHLIYPLPPGGLEGLGIHATKTLDGRLRLGPNVFYVDSVDYEVDSEHATEFFDSARAYLPFLEFADLQPDMAGIRPKLQAPGAPFRDFVICHETERGFRGLINLIGIESPGLTSALSLAVMVADLIEEADK